MNVQDEVRKPQIGLNCAKAVQFTGTERRQRLREAWPLPQHGAGRTT